MGQRWSGIVVAGLMVATALQAAAGPSELVDERDIVVNPNPGFSLRVWVDRDPAKTANPVYRVGERLRVFVRTSQNAYVYVFNVRANGSISLIVPNAYETENLLRAGQEKAYPGPGARYVLTVEGPAGQDRVFALASARRLSLGRIMDTARGRVLVQGADDLGRAVSLEVQPLPRKDWVTDVAFFRVATGAVVPPAPGGEHTGTISYRCRISGDDRSYTIRAVYAGGGAHVLLTAPGRILQMIRTVHLPQNRYTEYTTQGFKWVTAANRTAQLQQQGRVLYSCSY